MIKNKKIMTSYFHNGLLYH